MSDLKTTIKVGADSSGVATGLEPGKRSLKDFGGAATDAGKALGGIGNGGAASAQKVESATKSMVNSIQRQIAATEAGDKASRKYQESLARMRGVDPAALKPYLDQLDAVKMKQAEAAKATSSFSSSLGAVKIAAMAAAASAGALAVFSKSIIDAADGMNDLSQRVGISVRELGKYKLAVEQSGTSMEAIAKGVKGLAENMLKNGDAMRKAGIDATTADGAMQQLADVFADMPDGIEKTTLATKLFGKAGMDLIPMLNLGSEGLRDAAIASAAYAEQMSIMAPLADSLNDKMAVIALSAKTAGATMVNEFLPSLNKIASAFTESKDDANSFASLLGGVFNTAIQTAAILVSDVVFVLKGMGREIGAIAAQTVALANLDFKGFTAIGIAVKEDAARARAELDKFQANMVASAVATSVKVQDAYNKRQGFNEKSGAVGSSLLAALGGGESAAKKALDEVAKAADKAKKALDAMHKAGDAGAKAHADALNKERDGIDAWMRAQTEGYAAAAKGSRDAVTAAQAEYDQYGMSKSQIAEITLLKLADQLVTKTAGSEAYESIQKQIDAQKELIGIMRKTEARDAGIEAAKVSAQAAADATAEWQKASDSINNSLTDALMRGFESGKDFAKNMRDTIVNMFKTMVLRPVISAVLSPVSQGITGMIGLSGAASAASTGSSLLSGAGSLATLGSSIGTSIAGTVGSAIGSVFGTTAGNVALGTTLGLGTSSSLAAASAASVAGGGAAASTGLTAAASALGAIPVWGWAALAGVAALAIFEGGETRSGAQYGVGTDGKATKLEGPSGGEIAATQAQAMFNVTKSSIEGMLTGLGSKAVLTGFTAGLESSENGKGFAYSTGQINGVAFGDTNTYNNSRGDKTAEQALKDYEKELSQSVLEALQVTADIPAAVTKLISDGLNGSEVKDLSLEASNAILATISQLSTEVNTFNGAMQLLPFESLKDLSFDTAAGLIAAAGGFEKLDANLSGYYTNFYTQEEQKAQLASNTSAAFAELGLVMPELDSGARAAYRSLVDQAAAQDLSVEANAKAYTSLLALQGSMNELAPAFDQLAQAAANTVADLQASIATLNGVSSSDYSAQQSRMTATATLTAVQAAMPWIKDINQLKTIDTSAGGDFSKYSGANQALILAAVNAAAQVYTLDNQSSSTVTSYTDTATDTSAADAAAAAAEEFYSKLTALQSEYDDLTLTQAEKRNAELLSLNAQDPTGQLTSLQESIWAVGDAADKAAADLATATTRNQWRDKADVLAGAKTQEQVDTQNALAGVTDLATVGLIMFTRELERTAAASKEVASWQEKLNALDGETGAAQNRAIALQRDLDNALSDSARSLITQVYAQEDLAAATEKATAAADTLAAAFDSLESARVSVASAYKSIEDNAAATAAGVVSAQDGITQGYLSAQDAVATAQERIADLARQSAEEMHGFADSLRDFLTQMATTDLGGSSKASQYAALQADFAITAAQARAGDKDAYGSITGKATSLLDAGREQSGTALEYARLSANVGNTLNDLATLADGKAGPLAEAVDPMVQAQEDLLAAQLDLGKWSEAASVSGASTAKTIDDYLKDWRTASAADALAQADLKAAQLLTQDIDLKTLDVLGELKVLIAGYNTAKDAVVAAGGSVPTTTTGSATTTTGSTAAVDTASTLALAAYSTWQGYMQDAGADLTASYYADIKQSAWTASGLSGIPAFAVGTNYVPSDMLAQIHEGEAIIPKAHNPYNPNSQGNNDTAAALRALADRLDKIEANTNASARHAAATDRKLARVIPGNALITEAAV